MHKLKLVKDNKIKKDLNKLLIKINKNYNNNILFNE